MQKKFFQEMIDEYREFFIFFSKYPRTKILGIFLLAVGFVAENLLRRWSHFLAEGLLLIFGRSPSGAGPIADKIFNSSSPLLFVYIPLTVVIFLVVRDGLQKTDWVVAPFCIGVLLKAAIYAAVCLGYKSGEFWELTHYGLPAFVVGLFAFVFLAAAGFGAERWFRDVSK